MDRAKRDAAIAAEIDQQRPVYRSNIALAVAISNRTFLSQNRSPMTNAILISIAECAGEVLAAIPDAALRQSALDGFVNHMTASLAHYLTDFANGERQSVAIHDTSAPAN